MLPKIGLIFYGISDPDENDVATATRWFMFVYLPLIPLGRYRIQLTDRSPEIIESIPWDGMEILKTIIYAWVYVPFKMAVPMVIVYFVTWIFDNPTILIIGLVVWFVAVIMIAAGEMQKYVKRLSPKAERTGDS